VISASFLTVALALAAGPGGALSGPGTFQMLGRDYLSVTDLARSCGTRVQVSERAGIYTFNLGKRQVRLMPGFDVAYVDGEAVNLGAPVAFNDAGELSVPARLLGPAGPKAAAASDSIPLKRVVIDAGHGGQDSGALGTARVQEKDVALGVALRLKEALESRGVEVVMTRQSDRFVPLPQRSEIANRSGADLFLSIHCNACPAGGISGVETFSQSPAITDAQRARKASARLAPADMIPGAARKMSPSAEQAVFSAYLAQQRRQSLALAGCLQDEMVRSLGEADRGVKVKNLAVLRETFIPAALVEVGFITDAATEQQMRSPARRQKIADALLAGLGRYARGETAR
jgi:N-acetylmuramoyl-L-alanine amidase